MKTEEEKKEEKKKEAIEQAKNKFNFFLLKYYTALNIFLAVLVVGAGIFFLLPKYNETIKGAKEAGEAVSEKIESRRKYLKELQSVLSAYNDLSEEEKIKIDKMIPAKYEKEELFGYLEYLVLQSGALLSAIHIEEETDEKKSTFQPENNEEKMEEKLPKESSAYNVKISILGSDYKTFKTLLKSLESSLRLMDVKNVLFIPESSSVEIDLSTYFIK